MLRISNKKGADGKPHNSVCFDEQDKLILSVFAEAAVKALESAELSDARIELSKELEQKHNLFLQLLDSAHAREANLKDLALYDIKCGILMHNQNQLVRNLKKRIVELRDLINDSASQPNAQSKLLTIIKDVAMLSESLEELYRSTDGQIERVRKSLHSLAEILENEIHLRRADVSKRVSREYGIEDAVEVDEALIRHVFTVFCDNAVDAMSEVKRPKVLDIQLTNVDGRWCSIRFADTGTGMSPELWQQIVDQQTPPLNTWKQMKGLRAARLAIEEFGGSINLDLSNTSHRGTTFEIRLPLVQAPPP